MSLVTPVRLLLGAILLTAVSACYTSESPLIGDGEGVLPIDGQIRLCLEKDDCFDMRVEADGYTVIEDFDNEVDAGRIRFTPFLETSRETVWIGETWSAEDNSYLYVLARLHPKPSETDPDLQLAAPDCGALTPDQRDAFIAAGGEITGEFVTYCRPVSLDQLRTVLLSSYSESVRDDDWWTEQMN